MTYLAGGSSPPIYQFKKVMIIAGDKQAPKNWKDLPHIQRKWIKGHLYIYQYDPITQTEKYLGAAEPVHGIIESMSQRQKRMITKMFVRGDLVDDVVKYVKGITGYKLTKQSVYNWFREKGNDERWNTKGE